MHGLRIRTLDSSDVLISAETIDGFRARLAGPLLGAADAGYDQARTIWNAMIDRRPALIVRASGTADVVETVRFARERRLLLSIRGGGHNIAGTAVCDGGLMLDLSALRGIHVDPAAGTARVQAGALWSEVDREAQLFGRGVPSGIVSATGVAGLTLGGGFGWLTRRCGLTSDNLLSADLVAADGALLHASETENRELFWGLRGGGGNFGIVTSFEFRLQPVGPQVVGGMVIHPMARAEELTDFFRDLTESAPEELTCILILRKAPPAPFLPKEIHGAPIAAIAACHTGSLEEGERAVCPIKAFGEPVADLIGPKPFVAVQRMLDAVQPPGRHYYWKSDYFRDLHPDAAATMIEHAGRITSPQSSMLFMHLGGAMKRVPEQASAAGPRDVDYVLNIAGSWLEPGESERHTAWVQDFWHAMRRFSSGRTYMNFLTADAGADRVRASFAPATYERLAALKARYDPDNLFRLNQNIRPAA
jgi:FAD/FMN-containing dehydrogenase